MFSGTWHCITGGVAPDILKKNASVFKSKVVQSTGTFFFYSLTLKLKTQHSLQTSGTTHPVTHRIPEVQHPQYLISVYISNTHECGFLSPWHGASSGYQMEERPPIWRVAVNKLNKQPRTADEGWSSSLRFGRAANNPSP